MLKRLDPNQNNEKKDSQNTFVYFGIDKEPVFFINVRKNKLIWAFTDSYDKNMDIILYSNDDLSLEEYFDDEKTEFFCSIPHINTLKNALKESDSGFISHKEIKAIKNNSQYIKEIEKIIEPISKKYYQYIDKENKGLGAYMKTDKKEIIDIINLFEKKYKSLVA